MNLLNQLSLDGLAVGLLLAVALYWALRTGRLARAHLPAVLGGGVLAYGFLLLTVATVVFKPQAQWPQGIFVDLFVSCCTGLAAYWSGRAL
jgi:hypothetical protein